MIARASQNNVHVSPRKAKLVCDLIRNKPVKEALNLLEYTNKKSAIYLKKLLNQAISNAINTKGMSGEKLYVYTVVANQGIKLKRTMPRAKGSADVIRKRHTNFVLTVSDDELERAKELAAIKAKIKKRADNNRKNKENKQGEVIKKTKPVVATRKVSQKVTKETKTTVPKKSPAKKSGGEKK